MKGTYNLTACLDVYGLRCSRHLTTRQTCTVTRVPTPHRKQPRYRVIADELRRRIQAGAIPPGALLPAESALIAEFQVSRGTVRQAIDALRAEALVVTEHGRGTYARPQLPVRRLGPDRYRLPAQTGAATTPAKTGGIPGRSSNAVQVEADYRKVPATGELARLFEIEPGAMLLQRRLLVRENGVPQELTTSYYPLDLVAGTPVADPNREPWPGGHLAQLTYLGITVTSIRETIRARMPTTTEAQALQLPAGIPILTITRQTHAEDQIVEVAHDITLPADRTELEHETP